MRKKLFARSAEVHRQDPVAGLKRWRAAQLLGFSCALCVTILGAVLKFIGAGWPVTGIFFAVSLGFLALWRPRSNLQPS